MKKLFSCILVVLGTLYTHAQSNQHFVYDNKVVQIPANVTITGRSKKPDLLALEYSSLRDNNYSADVQHNSGYNKRGRVVKDGDYSQVHIWNNHGYSKKIYVQISDALEWSHAAQDALSYESNTSAGVVICKQQISAIKRAYRLAIANGEVQKIRVKRYVDDSYSSRSNNTHDNTNYHGNTTTTTTTTTTKANSNRATNGNSGVAISTEPIHVSRGLDGGNYVQGSNYGNLAAKKQKQLTGIWEIDSKNIPIEKKYDLNANPVRWNSKFLGMFGIRTSMAPIASALVDVIGFGGLGYLGYKGINALSAKRTETRIVNQPSIDDGGSDDDPGFEPGNTPNLPPADGGGDHNPGFQPGRNASLSVSFSL